MQRLKLKQQKLVAIFLVGMLLLFSPIISLLERPLTLFGLPVLHLYLFGVWAVLIAAMAWVVRGKEQ